MLRRRTPYVYNGTGGGFNELIRLVLGGANETEELDYSIKINLFGVNNSNLKGYLY